MSDGTGVIGGKSIMYIYLFKKIRDNKGTFHAKIGTIKETNGFFISMYDKIHYKLKK